MKIKCEFCGSMINDTESVCPSCGAPNKNVRRSSGDQPLTIQELRQWYESKGLPPESVTRFFIGKDIREPRAFGIYFDENTGNYIVYKNKASGQRAVRYQGTDEAYAVNELFQRLKQEITQQKMNNAKKQQGSGQMPPKKPQKSLPRRLLGLVGKLVGAFVGCIVFLLILGLIVTRNDITEGYYIYGNTGYYYSSTAYQDLNWFRYDTNRYVWEGPLDTVPEALTTKKQAKEHFVQTVWTNRLPCDDFADSLYGQDLATGMTAAEGLYQYGSAVYFHLSKAYDQNWYQYKTDWQAVDFQTLPQELQHPSLTQEYLLPSNHLAGVPDFTKTLTYLDYHASTITRKGYYRVEDQVLYHLGDRYDEDWYLYEDDSWRRVDTQAIPEPLTHPGIAEDFYFTPTWDPSTQFTDFEDTSYYQDAQKKDSWLNDDDNSYDWDSGDSWDSGDTDWDSDW